MTDSQTLAEDYAETMRDSIAEAMRALREGDPIEGQDAAEYIDEWPLEIVHQVGRPFEIVLTLGGPDARVVCELDSDGERYGSAKVEVHWGSGRARRYSEDIDAFADYFAQMFE